MKKLDEKGVRWAMRGLRREGRKGIQIMLESALPGDIPLQIILFLQKYLKGSFDIIGSPSLNSSSVSCRR
ncbi:hypothetical protein M405DRAFT_832613 [Rhizopogon salebrosus TDB-379]|nr:hypothetical protein M405DRAFT_832613 [Rhizopogon salebrosus TDB-379]